MRMNEYMEVEAALLDVEAKLKKIRRTLSAPSYSERTVLSLKMVNF